MSNGAKVALAVGAGYFLGRTRKMRIALMLAAAGVTGKLPGSPAALAAQGLKQLGSSAELGQLTEQLRGELLGAARTAAVAAATNRVDALNNRLQGVTGAVGADEALDEVGSTVDAASRPVKSVLDGGSTRRRRAQDLDEEEAVYDDEDRDEDLDDADLDEEDLEDQDLDEDEEDFEDEADEDEDLDDTDLDEEPEEEPEPPVRRRRATRQPSSPRASVRRSARAAAHEEPSVRAARRRSTATNPAPVRRGR